MKNLLVWLRSMQKNCCQYPVEFVEDIFGESSVLADTLKKVTGSDKPRILLVADMNVVHHIDGIGTKIGKYINEHNISLAGSPVVLAGSEKIKTDKLQSALRVVSAILDTKLGVADCVVALGGGAILDVVGYAASQVRGGISVVRVPTTPAAMMDAAFAEYSAVDSDNIKDALRVANIPKAVLIDTSFANTVLEGVWRAGIGEAVRLAAACDSSLMKKIIKHAEAYRNREPKALEEIVKTTVATRLKKGATSLGLWCAMRLESMSGYKLPHGYAVSIAICIEALYAKEIGMLKEADCNTITNTLMVCGALDGLGPSKYLFGKPDSIMLGLDAWRLVTGSEAIEVLTGIGKSKGAETPDRDAMIRALNMI